MVFVSGENCAWPKPPCQHIEDIANDTPNSDSKGSENQAKGWLHCRVSIRERRRICNRRSNGALPCMTIVYCLTACLLGKA